MSAFVPEELMVNRKMAIAGKPALGCIQVASIEPHEQFAE